MADTYKSNIIAMTIANAVALAMAILGYFLYSKLLSPAEFGVYAGALSIAKFGGMLLDGGLKIALIKHEIPPSGGVLRALHLGSRTVSLVGLIGLSLVFASLVQFKTLDAETAMFFVGYAAAYFLTYPFLFIPLAQLERALQFSTVAKVEAVSISIEYALPALLWVFVDAGFWTFVVSVWIARGFRAAAVLLVSSDKLWLTRQFAPQWQDSKALLSEGFALQMAVLVSMLRDSLHLLMVGPFFGKDWAGYYAWAMQLCAVTSQVFVQTAMRVALPSLRGMQTSEARWQSTLTQMVWLTICTAPPLVFLVDMASAANVALFDAKWGVALMILPYFVIRMLPSLGTTPMGALILADKGAKTFAIANVQWTLGEIVVAAACLYLYGPYGLAISSAFMAWFGLYVFSRPLLGKAQFMQLLAALIIRPSVWGACLLLLAYHAGYLPVVPDTKLLPVLMASAAGTLLCVAMEPQVWGMLKKLLNPR